MKRIIRPNVAIASAMINTGEHIVIISTSDE